MVPPLRGVVGVQRLYSKMLKYTQPPTFTTVHSVHGASVPSWTLWLYQSVSCRSWLEWRDAPGLIKRHTPSPSLAWLDVPTCWYAAIFLLLVVCCWLVTWFCWVWNLSCKKKHFLLDPHLSGLNCCQSNEPYFGSTYLDSEDMLADFCAHLQISWQIYSGTPI